MRPKSCFISNLFSLWAYKYSNGLVVVYRSDKDGRVWVRPEAEFRQRFAKAGHVTPAKTVKKDEGDEFVEVTPSA